MPSPRRPSSHSQVTQPVRVRPVPSARAAAPYRPAPPAPRRAAPPRPQPRRKTWPLYIALGLAGLVMMTCAALTLAFGLVYAGGILPGVYAGGVALGGLSEKEAVAALQNGWQTIIVRDEARVWTFHPGMFGIMLDAEATARAAYAQGRAQFDALLPGLIGRVDVPPVLAVDLATAEANLREFAPQFEQPPVNAGVRLVNSQVQPTAPVSGRALDVAGTLARLRQEAALALADGTLELVMQPVQPAVTDAAPMVERAARLLSSFLDIRLFDPVTGDSVYWSLPPSAWSEWLAAEPDPDSPTGLALSADAGRVRAYLEAEARAVLDSSRYLELDEAVAGVQAAIRQERTDPSVRVYHHDRQHIVQPGETIIRIAWDYGVPYPYIQQANGDLDSLSPGQSIIIPSPDVFMPYPVNPDKRIVVSISRQRAWVYENAALKWEWPVSTGIASSPTWPGIYQIISHVDNAYAANWNLWMPNFMGVYRPIPGADFTNGFHGFPTRGGSQLLWTNSLGTRVTYGCILLSNENAQALYTWAEEGVIVEIQA
ncbi:MAG: L,D-transpeptidase family protein [Chloroflexi bacterium]|nr:L,D-transpeptidase family protein [Chloroflexota bacterium]